MLNNRIWGQVVEKIKRAVYKLRRVQLKLLGQNRKENYELFILDSCTNSSACSIFIYGSMGVSCKRQATSSKRQAASAKQKKDLTKIL